MIEDDLLNYGKAKARTLRLTERDEGLKHFIADSFGNSRPVIRDRDLDSASGAERNDADAAGFWLDGFAGILQQVNEDAFKLRKIKPALRVTFVQQRELYSSELRLHSDGAYGVLQCFDAIAIGQPHRFLGLGELEQGADQFRHVVHG